MFDGMILVMDDALTVFYICNSVHIGIAVLIKLLPGNVLAGLDHAKKCVTEMVIWPLLRPDIFKGCRSPGKGLLLFGPPVSIESFK